MKFLYCLILLALVACQRQATEAKSDPQIVKIETSDSLQNIELENIQFSDYVNRIPQIVLPLTFSCDSGLVWAKMDYQNKVISKYKPEGASIIGKIYQTDSEVGILYTYPADITFPVIQVFDNNEKELSKTDLFELGNCVSEPNYNAITRGQITKNLELISWIEIIQCDGEKCDTTKSNLKIALH